ncbi:hypothetical protein RvY_16302 [Ramazzottius varieornatus]|uniref:Uncharacterized protein n=1 Tax=Ramazzottius varieornatus TaxID=947166 RepID=A0A1D1VXZ1_RAMVA|nr:hypothetical protein RvY_16302 [Ramazzottius varieornatus]
MSHLKELQSAFAKEGLSFPASMVALNGYVVWCETHPTWKASSKIKRREYLEELSKELMKSHLERRRHVVNLPVATKSVINKALKVSTVVGLNVDPPAQVVLQHTPTGSKVQRRCQLCPRSTDKKTRAVFRCFPDEVMD